MTAVGLLIRRRAAKRSWNGTTTVHLCVHALTNAAALCPHRNAFRAVDLCLVTPASAGLALPPVAGRSPEYRAQGTSLEHHVSPGPAADASSFVGMKEEQSPRVTTFCRLTLPPTAGHLVWFPQHKRAFATPASFQAASRVLLRSIFDANVPRIGTALGVCILFHPLPKNTRLRRQIPVPAFIVSYQCPTRRPVTRRLYASTIPLAHLAAE